MANIIPKGCTSTNTFTFPYEAEDVSVLYVTYQQFNKTIIEFEKDDCMLKSGNLIVELSQADTLKFDSRKEVSIQIRARLNNGVVIKSNIVTATVDTILKMGEI